MSPLAPPSFQRSCWKAAIRCFGLVGSALTQGSTSAPGKFLLPAAIEAAIASSQAAEVPGNGWSGDGTGEPAVSVPAKAVVAVTSVTIAPTAAGASHFAERRLRVVLIRLASFRFGDAAGAPRRSRSGYRCPHTIRGIRS